eukprot:Em0009g482a
MTYYSSYDRCACLWDVRSGRCAKRFDQHESDVNAVRFLPTGDALGTTTNDGGVGLVQLVLGGGAGAGQGVEVHLFDLRADQEIRSYTKPSIICGAAALDFSKSGRILFAAYDDHSIRAWDVVKGTQLFVLLSHQGRISHIELSPDGTALASSSWDGTTRYATIAYPGDGTVAKNDKAISGGGGNDKDVYDGDNDSDVSSEDETRSEDGVLESEEPVKPAAPQVIEKIPEEDRRKPHVVKRVFFKIFPSLEKVEDQRILTANDPIGNEQYKYAKNLVVSAKYNILTFVPLNLFEQFTRVANIYFLALVILQSIPQISSVPFYSTLVPLLAVLLVTAVKDGYDDIRRHVSDYRINNRQALVLRNNRLEEIKWKEVRVGDVIKLRNDEFVTADLLLLSSSEPNSLVFIETAELDGETNLKVRQALPVTDKLGANEDQLSTFNGHIKCESPNNRLHKFVGTLQWNDETYPLDNEKILLRGCRLRNTQWMYGVVIYAGSDTKLVQNSENFISPILQALLQVFSNLIVLNTFIPISLYVSVEVIRLGLSLFINSDIKMYYEPNNVPAIARTTTLNEELGQVEYIFSDKTGTLTQNIMTFQKCSINGVQYGENTSEGNGKKAAVDFLSWNKYADKSFVFCDQTLIDKCRSGEQHCDEFFRLLSLCHTVMSKEDKGELQYNAQSPDEGALVGATKNFGYVFKGRTPSSITVHNMYTDKEVIVRVAGRIVLYCKGADNIIFERLGNESAALKAETLDHLAGYAQDGLRTLACAKREISEEEYDAWKVEHHAASILHKDRDQALDAVYEKIEKNLVLLGATAIEDKLQDGVPETIAKLARAHIKIWVLTGDKQETAINIGYSSKLLTDDMTLFIVDKDTDEGVRQQLSEAKEQMEATIARSKSPDPSGVEKNVSFGIVINGHSLKKVVDMVKTGKKAVTLAIGDGANDVGMIKAAHIGVGISGQEGQQAVLASDYSFGQFRYLERLLLVHGRWSYHRMTIFLRYFFYKNFAFAFSQFIFAFFCGFTAEPLYDPAYITFYNLIYTSTPVLAVSILDQDVDEKRGENNPKLYLTGQRNENFSFIIFLRSLIKGIYVAFVIFFVLFGITFLDVMPNTKTEWDYQSFGLTASAALTFVVNLQIILDAYYLNVFFHVFVWGSMIAWFVVILILGSFLNFFSKYTFVAEHVLATPNFWFYAVLACVIGLFPVITYRTLIADLYPTRLHVIRHDKSDEIGQEEKPGGIKSRPSVKRSGYAYSHTKGFAKLIVSGRIFGLSKKAVEQERMSRVNSSAL